MKKKLPCRVVSTQCIEAGADLDFDTVYRALAPLDSIIQAAGRCNRNGTLPGLGNVVVFCPEDEDYPEMWYENASKTVRRLYKDSPIDLHDPMEIRRYYKAIFSDLHDKPALKDAIEKQDYRTAAKEYQMIEKRENVQVIVPLIGQMELYHELKVVLEQGITPALMRKAAPITVSCFEDEKLGQIAKQIPFAKREEGMSPFYYLQEECYSPDMGLQIPDSLEINPLDSLPYD